MTSASTDEGDGSVKSDGHVANATFQSLSKLKSGRSHFNDIDAVDPAAVQNKVTKNSCRNLIKGPFI